MYSNQELDNVNAIIERAQQLGVRAEVSTVVVAAPAADGMVALSDEKHRWVGLATVALSKLDRVDECRGTEDFWRAIDGQA